MMPASQDTSISLFLCGDVMTGRGIDQVLPHPSNPVLYEWYVRDARRYVQLAEDVNGPIPWPVEPAYVWGDVLEELQPAGVDARIINLETSVTTSGGHWPDKPIQYRMHPGNVGCITALAPVCCCLANNHVMDWGYEGLAETLRTLDGAGVAWTGAGGDADRAAAPAVLDVPGKGRVLVYSFGSPTSGIPWEWAAAEDRPGVNFLPDLTPDTARRIGGRIRQERRLGDVVVVSVHWGGNWGYEISEQETAFAHRLVEEGAAVVHGHSSHHVKTVEVYRDRLILYGCGDFLTDYEGIGGREEYRGDLGLMYLVKVDAAEGRLLEARLVPMQPRRFRLQRTTPQDARWLCGLLNRLGEPSGTRVELQEDGSLSLRWP